MELILGYKCRDVALHQYSMQPKRYEYLTAVESGCRALLFVDESKSEVAISIYSGSDSRKFRDLEPRETLRPDNR